MAKEGGKRAGEGVHGGGLSFRVLGGAVLCLLTHGRRKTGVSVSRVPGGPPNLLLTWSPFLFYWDSACSSPLRRPSHHRFPALVGCLPASPPFDLLPHWGPGSFTWPSVLQLTVIEATCIPICPLKMGGMEPCFAQSLSLSL